MNGIDPQHLRLLEAILFTAAEPIPERALARMLPPEADVPALLAELAAHYAERGVNLTRAGGSWAFRTAPDLAASLRIETQLARKLGRAAVETLAIIAYHQPVTRAEVEAIRGVGFNKGVLDTLFEAGWVRPRGRRRTPGRPMTWGTTDLFLDHFGLESLDDLPGIDELKATGLLDARPAIETVPRDGATDGEAEGDHAGPLFADEEEKIEPLDPDG